MVLPAGLISYAAAKCGVVWQRALEGDVVALALLLSCSWGLVIARVLLDAACAWTGYDPRRFEWDEQDDEGRMDPAGSRSDVKNKIAWLMAMIARKKEMKKFASETSEQLERFHDPVDHPFFNESYYFNGADENNQRFIVRRQVM